MAVWRRGGRGGWKASVLCFSQPRGAVMTSSSKWRDSFCDVVTVTGSVAAGSSDEAEELMDVTFVDNCKSA